jgi:hypothetical protein
MSLSTKYGFFSLNVRGYFPRVRQLMFSVEHLNTIKYNIQLKNI